MSEYGRALKDARDALSSAYHGAIEAHSKLGNRDRATDIRAEFDRLALNAPLVSLCSYRVRNLYVQHTDYLGWLKTVGTEGDRLNATFELVPGLADGSCVSFRSINVPDHYLVHGDFRIKLQPEEPSDVYRRNGAFRQVKGLAAPAACSFEAINYPGHYIRSKGGSLVIERFDGTPLFRSDATFVVTDPQFRLWEPAPR
jgi:hypothetical protein